MLKKLSVLFLIGVLTVAGLGVLLSTRIAHPAEVSSAAQSEDGAADWPALQGNAARTGAVRGLGPTANPEVAWRFNLRSDSFMIGPPIVSGDTVYVAGNDFPEHLYALDAATGVERWHASVGFFTDVEAYGGGQLLTVDNGIVYVAGTEGEAQCDCMPPAALYALDSATGKELWRHSFGRDRNQSAPAVVDGTVYMAVDDWEGGAVYAFDASTGAVRWETHGDEPSFDSIPVAVNAGAVYAIARSIDSQQSFLISLDAATGVERWLSPLGKFFYYPPAVTSDSAFLMASNFESSSPRSDLIALDVATGTERWRVQLASESFGTLTVWEDTVYVGTVNSYGPTGSSGPLLALDATTGTERWRIDDANSPAVAGSVLYAISPDGIIALDAATGAAIWTLTGTSHYGSIVIANGMGFAVGAGGLIAFSGSTGPAVSTGAPAQPGDDPVGPIPAGDETVDKPTEAITQEELPDAPAPDEPGEEEIIVVDDQAPGEYDPPTASGETATVTVEIVPPDASSQALEFVGEMCVMVRTVSSNTTPVTGVCNNDPPDSDDSPKLIAFELPTGSSYEIDIVSSSQAPGFIVIGIDEEGLRPLTSAGGTVTIHLGTQEPPPTELEFPDSSIVVTNADGSNPTTLTSGPMIFNPVWSPDGTRIAFEGSSSVPGGQEGSGPVEIISEGEPDIWIMNADGSNPTILAPVPGWDTKPSWSPDGRMIAFLNGNGSLYVVNSDGTGLRELAQLWGSGPYGDTSVMFDPMSSPPSWSPDGSEITFSAAGDGGGEVWVINVDGTGLTRLTDFGALATSTPKDLGEPFEIALVTVICPSEMSPGESGTYGAAVEILPDGDPAEFEAKGCRRAGAGEASFALMVKAVSEEGAKQPQVTQATTDAQGVAVLRGFLDPDATFYGLAESGPVAAQFPLDGPPFAATYVMVNYGSDPSGVEIPLESMMPPSEEPVAEGPSWSPDGTKIAFFVVNPFDMSTGRPTGGGVYVMNPDGSGEIQITDVTPETFFPLAWSPDSTKLLFYSHESGNDWPDLYVVNADGSGVTKLLTPGRRIDVAAWTPEGRIVVSTYELQGVTISMIEADGSGETELYVSPMPMIDPAWSPDGSKIAFVVQDPSSGEGYTD